VIPHPSLFVSTPLLNCATTGCYLVTFSTTVTRTGPPAYRSRPAPPACRTATNPITLNLTLFWWCQLRTPPAPTYRCYNALLVTALPFYPSCTVRICVGVGYPFLPYLFYTFAAVLTLHIGVFAPARAVRYARACRLPDYIFWLVSRLPDLVGLDLPADYHPLPFTRTCWCHAVHLHLLPRYLCNTRYVVPVEHYLPLIRACRTTCVCLAVVRYALPLFTHHLCYLPLTFHAWFWLRFHAGARLLPFYAYRACLPPTCRYLGAVC